jgi:hypothetical protein
MSGSMGSARGYRTLPVVEAGQATIWPPEASSMTGNRSTRTTFEVRQLESSDQIASLGRDAGPVSARNSSKGALLPEAHAVFRALASGKTTAEARTDSLTGRLLRQSTRETRHITPGEP